MNTGFVTIKVEKPIHSKSSIEGSTISFAKAIELPARRLSQKLLMPFNPRNPFMYNPEMDFSSSISYDLPIWPRKESIHVKLNTPDTRFKQEMRIPRRNIIPVSQEESSFHSNFPMPPLSYVFPEGQEANLFDEEPNIANFNKNVVSKSVVTNVDEDGDLMKDLPPILPATVVSNKEIMDMRPIVQFPGKLPIFEDEKFPAPEGQIILNGNNEKKNIKKDSSNAAPKRVYTANEIMNYMPDTTENIERLRTPGFLVLVGLSDYQMENSFNTRRAGFAPKANLIEHNENVFLTTSFRKKVGDFVDESMEKKLLDAKSKLNQLNQLNMSDVIQWFKKEIGPLLPMSSVVYFILEIATMDTTSPENNQQIGWYARLSHYLCEDSDFRTILVNSTNERIDDLIKDDNGNIRLLEALIVWYAHLLKETIISPYSFFRELEKIVVRKEREAAVSIICKSLMIGGSYLSERKFSEVATFYRFINDNKHLCSGYVAFLVDELINNRFKPVVHQQEVVKQSSEIIVETDLAVIGQDLEMQYESIMANETNDLSLNPEYQLNDIIAVMFKQLKNHMCDIRDFCYYLCSVIDILKFDHSEIRRQVQIQHPLFQQIVIEEDNANLWNLAFIFYGELFNLGLFSFVEIINFFYMIPKEGPQPKVEVILPSFLSSAIIEEKDVIEAAAKTSLLKNEFALSDAISYVNVDSEPNAEERSKEIDREAKPPLVNCGFFFRRVIFDLFGTEESQMKYKEILKKFQKTFKTTVRLYPYFWDMIYEVTIPQLEADEGILTEFKQFVSGFLKRKE